MTQNIERYVVNKVSSNISGKLTMGKNRINVNDARL